jgi:ribosomal protein L37E
MPIEERPAESAPPDWDMIPFDVGCSRCGQELRGQSEPVCPACGLEFAWSDLVPLEALNCTHCGYHLYGLQDMRCPECGSPFTWEALLKTHHEQTRDLFEYQWKRRPLRSLISTAWRAARPRTFWTSMDIHAKPRVRPLLLMVLGSMIAVAVVLLPLMAIADASLWKFLLHWRSQLGIPSLRTFDWQWRVLASFEYAFLRTNSVQLLLLLGLFLAGCNLVALLLLQQSMSRYRVRCAQVVRVWAYAALPVILIFPIVTAVWSVANNSVVFHQFQEVWPGGWWELDSRPAPFFFGLYIWSVRCAYRDYLRMPHGAAVAVLTLIVGVLGSLCLVNATTWMFPRLRYMRTCYNLVNYLGIP